MPANAESPQDSQLPVSGGTFVAVVGPSGSGKDTLLNYARRTLADRQDVFFVRRIITRPRDGATEDHTPASVEQFEKDSRDGRFAFHWDAHGLKYGLPAEIDTRIGAGDCAVCNGSRAALRGLSKRYANFLVISVTASRQVLASRLALRGRESSEEIHARLERGAGMQAHWPGAVIVDNSTTIEAAGDQLVAAILARAGPA